MHLQYSNLIAQIPHQTVAESKAPYLCLSERHIQAVWMEQKYFRNLRVSQGDSIEVISPGIWNHAAGPDFLKAHLLIGGKEKQGDVEIHLSPDDWVHHRHHLDPRYDQVILHLSLWEPKNLRPALTSCGEMIPQLFLEKFLTVPQERLIQLIDLDLYPYKKFIGSGRCAQNLFQKTEEKRIEEFFQSAAAWRLMQKRSHIAMRVSSLDLHLGAGIAQALGYKNNAEIFLQLFLDLLPMREIGEEPLLALALGSCGFFEKGCQEKWMESERYRHLHALFMMQAMTRPLRNQSPLKLNQIRPLNHPVRRLVYLTKLMADPSLFFLYPRINEFWFNEWENAVKFKKFSNLKNGFFEILPNYEDAYWNEHYTFERESQGFYLPLIGDQLKQEILINSILPLLYYDITLRGSPEEMKAFMLLYASLPASNNSKTKYLTHRFFGDSPKGKLLEKAQIEQGAFQLHRDFCLHFEASCEGCSFIHRFQENFNKQ